MIRTVVLSIIIDMAILLIGIIIIYTRKNKKNDLYIPKKNSNSNDVAIVKCSNCGKEFLNKDENCIYCGYHINSFGNKNITDEIYVPKERNVGLIIAIVILSILFIVGFIIGLTSAL